MKELCICCGALRWRPVVRLPKFLFGKKALIEECMRCGMGRTIPAPTLDHSYYQHNVRYEETFTSNPNQYRRFARNLLALLDRQGGRLLDVGCGGGFLVSEAVEMGFDALGIEVNVGVVEWAQNQQIPVIQGDLRQVVSKREKFDVIVFSAVLEHLERPDEVLKISRTLLTDNGVVLVSQASFDGLLPRLFPWGWYGWQPVEHYWHFTPRSMEALAEKCQFKVVKIRRRTLHHPFFLSRDVKVLLGRNLASLVGRIGALVSRGDCFDCILSPNGNAVETEL